MTTQMSRAANAVSFLLAGVLSGCAPPLANTQDVHSVPRVHSFGWDFVEMDASNATVNASRERAEEVCDLYEGKRTAAYVDTVVRTVAGSSGLTTREASHMFACIDRSPLTILSK